MNNARPLSGKQLLSYKAKVEIDIGIIKFQNHGWREIVQEADL